MEADEERKNDKDKLTNQNFLMATNEFEEKIIKSL